MDPWSAWRVRRRCANCRHFSERDPWGDARGWCWRFGDPVELDFACYAFEPKDSQ